MGNEAYLDDLWQQGVLLGCTQHEAYFVQVGEDPTKKENKINQELGWLRCARPNPSLYYSMNLSDIVYYVEDEFVD
ncbi:hypothetical protein DFQ29_001756 [Apophysomyces sp. BC1021]|nr:hypothetical protein DFQ29_001756 [Apophysomyces sp. BC1021]